MPRRVEHAAVAATAVSVDPDGLRTPDGDVHAWLPGSKQTLCGLSLLRSMLEEFPHVDWADVQPAPGRDAERVVQVCPLCAAAMEQRRDARP